MIEDKIIVHMENTILIKNIIRRKSKSSQYCGDYSVIYFKIYKILENMTIHINLLHLNNKLNDHK